MTQSPGRRNRLSLIAQAIRRGPWLETTPFPWLIRERREPPLLSGDLDLARKKAKLLLRPQSNPNRRNGSTPTMV
ncbi:MAG: hypothetical protein V6Z86_09225 [Hyphomicrobiales bacterium]